MHVASHDLFNMKLRTCLDTGSDNDIKTFFCNILSGKVDQLFMNEELTWILDRLGFIRTGQSNPVDG